MRNGSVNMISTSSTLQDLLYDMGRFLGETLKVESLTPTAEKQRNGLLQRLQQHLRWSGSDVTSKPNINTQTAEIDGPDGSNSSEEDYEELQVPIDHPPSPFSSSGRSDDSFENVSFSELKITAMKHGPLQRKEKGVFADQWRKYATVLHRHFLYMYSSEKGIKPSASVDIQGFIARPVANPENDPKKNLIFEIVCPGKIGYQFTARTVKDMHQWVAAICKASVEFIRISPSPLPDVTTDKSVSRGVQDVSALNCNEFEFYDDAGAVTNFNETAELQLSVGEYYHDVSNVHQGNASLESKPDCEVAFEEKTPTLPPRRRLPPVPQNGLSYQEYTYDDTGVSKQQGQYKNMVGVDGIGRTNTEIQTGTISKWRTKTVQPGTGTEEGHTTLQPSTDKEGAHKEVQPETDALHTTAQPLRSAKHKTQYNSEEDKDEGEEDIYCDIEISDESTKPKKSPVLQKKCSITNGVSVKSRAKALEKSLFKDGYQPKPKTTNHIALDMNILPKPIKNSRKDRLSPLPQIQTASHNSKPDTFDQSLQTKSNPHKPNNNANKITAVPSSNTQRSSQPPELPPRSYRNR